MYRILVVWPKLVKIFREIFEVINGEKIVLREEVVLETPSEQSDLIENRAERGLFLGTPSEQSDLKDGFPSPSLVD